MSVPFQFYMPIVDLSKADDGTMRFGGFTSSSATDQQGEDVIQKGLDFTEFERDGWFNVNHSQDITTDGIVGVPLDDGAVIWLRKGEAKPVSQEQADRPGWYVTGDLLDTKEGRAIWEKAVALKKLGTKRHLGMSLEGEVLEREGPRIKKAKVRKIAITERAVNRDTTMEVLTKAFTGQGPWITDSPSKEFELLQRIDHNLVVFMKALSAGADIDNPDPNPRVVGQGGQTPAPTKKALAAGAAIEAPAQPSPGEGFALRQEDLDGQPRTAEFGKMMDVYGHDYVAKDATHGYPPGDSMDKDMTHGYPDDMSKMVHDGIHGTMPAMDPYYMSKGKLPQPPEGGLWTPATTNALLEQRYPNMSKGQRELLVRRMFSHLGGT